MRTPFFVLVLALGAVAGCSGAARSVGSPAPAGSTLAVTNDNAMDVTVFVIAGEQRYRLGMVSTGVSAEFDLPPMALVSGMLSVMADPIGSVVAFLSEPLLVSPGERVTLRVANQLAQTAVSVVRGAGS